MPLFCPQHFYVSSTPSPRKPIIYASIKELKHRYQLEKMREINLYLVQEQKPISDVGCEKPKRSLLSEINYLYLVQEQKPISDVGCKKPKRSLLSAPFFQQEAICLFLFYLFLVCLSVYVPVFFLTMKIISRNIVIAFLVLKFINSLIAVYTTLLIHSVVKLVSCHHTW